MGAFEEIQLFPDRLYEFYLPSSTDFLRDWSLVFNLLCCIFAVNHLCLSAQTNPFCWLGADHDTFAHGWGPYHDNAWNHRGIPLENF